MTSRGHLACRSCEGGDIVPILPCSPSRIPQHRSTLSCAAAVGLVQITDTVAPEVLFGSHSRYLSSVSGALLAHARNNADELICRLRLHGRFLRTSLRDQWIPLEIVAMAE